jgi:hypothetical protein
MAALYTLNLFLFDLQVPLRFCQDDGDSSACPMHPLIIFSIQKKVFPATPHCHTPWALK